MAFIRYKQRRWFILMLILISFSGCSQAGDGDSAAESALEEAANQLPVAVISTPSVTGLTVHFDATGSTDRDGDLLIFNWLFGDGSGGEGQQCSHTYGAAGTYTVTLTVQDVQDGQDSATITVTLTDAGDASDDGAWGVPQSSFTIPFTPDGASGLYTGDIQAAYPEVDWQTLDRLYIPGGHYAFISIRNLPNRSVDRPLVISNIDGQVRVGGLGHYYLFSIQGGANWVLTGRYDPISLTGDEAFTGHRNNNYTGTRGTYGILIDDDFYPDKSNSGLGIGGGATDFEISYTEIREVGFAGINMKSNDDGDALMDNVRIHDNYIHDTKSEGIYIGSTQSPPQHPIENLEFYNNRGLRTGTEALQLGQLGDGCDIHHNVFGPAAIDWKDAFQAWQDNCNQIGVRYGQSRIHHNVFIGAAGSLISFFGQSRDGDTHLAGDEMVLHDNFYTAFRNLGAYIGGDEDGVSAYRFERNFFRGYSWQRPEVDPGAVEPGHLFRIANDSNPITLTDNRFEDSIDFTNRFNDPNGTDGNVSASGNVRGSVDPIDFNDFGLPYGFDYLRLEIWTDRSSRYVDGDPDSDPLVTYSEGDYVMHMGIMYRCIAEGTHSNMVPPDHPEIWQPLPLPPDDVRLAPGSTYAGIGLLDTVP